MQNKDYIEFICPCCNDTIKWNEQHPSSFLCTSCSSTCIVIKQDDGSYKIDIEDDSSTESEGIWDILVEKILGGDVIPVIGEEFVLQGKRTMKQILIETMSRKDNIDFSEKYFSNCNNISSNISYSQLIYHKKYDNKDREVVYERITKLLSKYGHQFSPSSLLKRFLAIKQFPFIITTTFDPVIENTMRHIWGERKRDVKTLVFDNDPKNTSAKGDITIDSDIEYPTIYYMFGKANTNLPHRFVVTDEDMLSFCKSWLSQDYRPRVLSRIVGTKSLLFLGCNYPDWLARFIWYSLRSDLVKSGMLVGENLESSLEDFMQRVNIETQNNPKNVIDQIILRIKKREQELTKTCFDTPRLKTDFFISYSRDNERAAHILYEKLNDMGLDVWYDRNKLDLGDNWREKIKKSIESTKFFIALISDNMKKDMNDSRFYRKEWNMAIEHDKGMPSKRNFIITLALDNTNIYDEQLDLPERITAGHALSIKNDSDYDNVVLELLKILNNLSK